MFEYVRLKNFKSFGDVELNLLDRNNNHLPFLCYQNH